MGLKRREGQDPLKGTVRITYYSAEHGPQVPGQRILPSRCGARRSLSNQHTNGGAQCLERRLRGDPVQAVARFYLEEAPYYHAVFYSHDYRTNRGVGSPMTSGARRVARFQIEHVHSMPKELSPGILYVSEEFRTAAHLCACGCGSKVRTPLGRDGLVLWKQARPVRRCGLLLATGKSLAALITGLLKGM